jgi:hypothetical protein
MKQNETDFAPTCKMLKLLEAAVDSEVEPSISAWCKAAGVARSQWYRWHEEEGFLDWFNTEYRRSFEGIKAALIKVGLQKALAGDFQFWKVMMERAGEYGPSLNISGINAPLIQIDAGANPYMDFKSMSDEELNQWLVDKSKRTLHG